MFKAQFSKPVYCNMTAHLNGYSVTEQRFSKNDKKGRKNVQIKYLIINYNKII